MRKIQLLAALAVLAMPATPAAADPSYPTRPVRMLVGFAPGGATDALARIIGERLGQALGQPVVIENRAGTGGSTGAAVVAQAPPDGYTLLMGTVSSHAINTSLYRSLPYDNVRDFSAIALVASGPNVLVVHPSVPAQSVPQLIAHLRANPGTVAYGSTGNGTSTHLVAEMFRAAANVDITHVPYRGSGPMANDLIAGTVQMSFDNLPSALAQTRAGRLRALAVTSAERWPTLPDVPAMGEFLPGFQGIAWFGLFAPAGLPEPILARLTGEMQRILADPDVNERLSALGVRPGGPTGPAFATFVGEETRRWAEIVRASGARVE